MATPASGKDMIFAYILLTLSAPGSSVAREPTFEDLPANQEFHGQPAPVRTRTAGQRMFRTVIEESEKKGPNFAGHYRIAEWGCGTGCISIAVVDAISGDVFDGPFGKLPRGSIYLGPPPDPAQTGLLFRVNSRLLVVTGCPNWKDCAKYYYEWQGNKFRLLLRRPLALGGK